MNPDNIELDNLSKIFEYEKISRELESCTNIDLLKNICRCYVKLYLKQQETLTSLDMKEFEVK
jgi:hypothetical protein